MNRVELHPIGRFEDKAALATDLHQMASNPEVRAFLDLRHHWTAIKNMSTPEATESMLRRAEIKADQGGMWTFAVTVAEQTAGLATLIPRLPLRRLRASLPPYPLIRLVPGIVLEDPVAVEGANVTAWVDNRRPDHKAELVSAYQALGLLAQEYHGQALIDAPDVWTIEPNRTAGPEYGMHGALELAGLQVAGSGYFDDGEQNKHFVPKSTLFVSPPQAFRAA